MGSIECSFGVGTAGTVTGGGQGVGGGVGPGTGALDPSPAGAIGLVVLWGVWGGYELYSHWDQWFDYHGGGTTSPDGSNGGGTTPGTPGGIGPIITKLGGGTILPIEPTIGTGTGNYQVGNSPDSTVGFSNGYASNLRKALGSRTVFGLCIGVTGAIALFLYGYETLEAARQNISDQQNYSNPQDYQSIWGSSALLCYGAAAGAYSVAGAPLRRCRILY